MHPFCLDEEESVTVEHIYDHFGHERDSEAGEQYEAAR